MHYLKAFTRKYGFIYNIQPKTKQLSDLSDEEAANMNGELKSTSNVR